MKVWIDAQLPPTLANWLTATFGLEAGALRDLALRDAQDMEIFFWFVVGLEPLSGEAQAQLQTY